jgi:Ca2+-binding RTX toxin-like protein
MAGGGGYDTYIVDNSNDKVIEGANAGNDLVMASASFTLGANVENLTLTGNSAIDATGNALENVIKGNAKANEIDGGGGDDLLTGKGGNDIFVFKSDSGDDRITDFKSGSDKIDVTAYGFASGDAVLAAASNTQGGVVIKLDNNNSVELTGLSKNQLNSNDFIVDKGEALGFSDLLDEGVGVVFADSGGNTANAPAATELGALTLLGDLAAARLLDDDLSAVEGIV